MTTKLSVVKFRRIVCQINQNNAHPISAVIELIGRDFDADQHRKRVIMLGHMQLDGLMMKFVLNPRIYVTDIGFIDNPFAMFDGHRVSPTMQGTTDFCNTLLAHLKLMEHTDGLP